MKNKRAFFFSTDALIALMIILLTVVVAYSIIKYPKRESNLQGDILEVLSSLKIGEINNSYVQTLISEGKIKDLNNSVLEQIGEFYVTDIPTAKSLGSSMLDYLNTSENIGIWYGGVLVASKNSSSYENAKNIEVERQIISGIEAGGSVTGYSARAYLESGLKTKYFYFGGYVGDGNISVIVNYNGTLKDVEFEIAIDKDFDIYLNNVFSGHYENSSSAFSPKKYNMTAYLSNFSMGENILKFVGDKLYIAGGFIKITYENPEQFETSHKHYFPGIEGLINLYDGFYIPSQLNTLDIFLHLKSNYAVFLTIGNVTVFRNSTNDEEKTITINNSQLSSLLDYSALSEKTIPLRLGLENVSYISTITKQADVFSVTDLSGSMCGTCSGVSCGWSTCCGWNCNNCNNNQPNCESCGGTCEDKIYNTKDANKDFIDIVLNSSGNRAGLVGYESDVQDSDCHTLSNNTASLKNKVDNWQAVGGTCICCGINRAVNYLNNSSSLDKFKSIVIMSDGAATLYCDNFDDYAGSGSGGSSEEIDRRWAINASCHAWQNQSIRVYASGFGSSADENTLKNISACGNGSYYYANISNLVDIYKQVAQDIIEATYSEQTIEVTGNISTILYPDSYMKFNFTEEAAPYGLITTTENKFSDSYTGSFFVPSDSVVLETVVISYSGPRWTSNAKINNNSAYALSNYGSDFTKLGDPYAINIPNFLIEQNNIAEITTGIYPGNSTEGSEYNKIISTLVRNMTSYSKISPLAEGCIWHIEFEDGSLLNLSIPVGYIGAENCYYESSVQSVSNENDAIQLAVYDLLELLDISPNGKLDVKFTEQNLQISSSEITGIPYVWSTEVQVRRWW